MTVDGFRLIENPPPDNHECPVPIHEEWYTPSAAVPPPGGWKDNPPDKSTRRCLGYRPDGQLGDVWQCAKCMQTWLLHKPPDGDYIRSIPKWTKISQRKAQHLVRRANRSKSSNRLRSLIRFLLIFIVMLTFFYLMTAVLS